MYPCVFWWNPIIYFPWSGPVTQDISPIAARVLAIENQMHRILHAMVAKNSLHPDNLPSLREDSELKKMRTADTKALLSLLRSLAPDEFAQIVKEEAATHGANSSV